MKRTISSLMIFAAVLVSCSKQPSGSSQATAEELAVGKAVTGTIAEKGEVNWYHFKAVESNNVLQVRCTGETMRPDVEFLVTMYQLDSQGNKVLIYGDHAPEGTVVPANLTLNAYIDQPRDIYITVRDLMDDESSQEPYHLSVGYASPTDNNDNFTQSSALTVNSSSPVTGTIGYVGDVDCYSFDSTGAVYDVGIVFSPFQGTQVQLSVSLYDSAGTLIENRSVTGSTTYHMYHYLSSGKYYLDVRDQGKDHFDNSSTYSLSVSAVSNTEAVGNDTAQTATVVNASQFNQSYTLNGTLDYTEDKDYYRIAAPTGQAGFKVLYLSFHAATAMPYQVNILDADAQPVLTHTYNGGSTDFHTQVKVESGDYYVMVMPASSTSFHQGAAYTATVSILDVVDAAEVTGNGNDAIGTADPLTATAIPAQATSGKISYRGDVDWYSLTIPAHVQPQILEVYLTAPVSQVEYTVEVMGAHLEKTLCNKEAETYATSLKTAIVVPADSSPAVYTFKVHDYQDDEGYDALYAFRVNLRSIPATLPALAPGAPPEGATVQYYSEATESSAKTVTLEINSSLHQTFYANTPLLDFAGAANQQDTPSSGLTTVTFPWISGYIDYQGDQDWFLIDLQPLDASTSWYYDIFVDIYAPASDVEYVWKFYPDRNDNGVVADRTSDYDGFIASAGDAGISLQTLNKRTPAAGESAFWVGNPWKGPAYFSISDFNYLRDQAGNPNYDPDEDWGGYDSAPYYFRVTLVYHPGVSYPAN
jgi:hypothetical protein